MRNKENSKFKQSKTLQASSRRQHYFWPENLTSGLLSSHWISEDSKQSLFGIKIEEDMICSDESNLRGEKLYQVNNRDMQVSPFHRFIGALFSYPDRASIPGKGSGVLISSNLVLTAAHNLVNPQTNQRVQYLQFYPALNGHVQNWHDQESFKYPEEFSFTNSPEYDYGLIKLNKKIPCFRQENQLTIAINFTNREACLCIFGYPTDNNFEFNKDASLKQGYQRGFAKKGVRQIKRKTVTYSISTQPGQSGCPVIQGNKIVGIHKAGVKDKPFNIARRLTFEMIVMLEVWREEMGGEKFKVVDLETNRLIDFSSTLIEYIKPVFKRQQQHIICLKELQKQAKHRGEEHSSPQITNNQNIKTNQLEEEIRQLRSQVTQRDAKIAELQRLVHTKKQIDRETEIKEAIEMKFKEYVSFYQTEVNDLKIKLRTVQKELEKAQRLQPQSIQAKPLTITGKYYEDIIKQMNKLSAELAASITHLTIIRTVPII